ncbi:hypothetical protein [Pseudooceanicola sp.]|uniref:hypothetical protein n=1 Tax=Pseudooceanicola sp. TaxID=1914328 RepID=UPI003518A489
MLDLNSISLTAQEAETVIGIDSKLAKSISNWANRGLITAQSEGGKGKPRRYSFCHLMEINIALELMAIEGFGPEAALKAGRRVAHEGSGGAGWDDCPLEGLQRNPGMPYHHSHGATLLLVGASHSQVVAVSSDTPFSHIQDLAGCPSWVTINVTEIFNHLSFRLGLDPIAVLDEAYPEDVAL